MSEKNAGPKILFLDIERTPATAYVWGLFDQRVSLGQILEPSRTFCLATRRGPDAETRVWSERTLSYRQLLKRAWKELDWADYVCSWNGASFDGKHLTGEFMELGLRPPSGYQHIDLYREFRKVARLQSGKLAWVGPALVEGSKLENGGFALWRQCMELDRGSDEWLAAWSLMERYNVQDVDLLVPMLEKLRPWIRNFPNLGNYRDEPAGSILCPRCGSGNYKKNGWHRTATRRYQRYLCKACAGSFQAGKPAADTTSRIKPVN